MSLGKWLEKTPIWMRYVSVMGASWVVDFAVFGVAGLFFNIPVSQAIARGCGAVTGFLLHKFGTFRGGHKEIANRKSRGLTQFLFYIALWLFGWLFSTLGILLLLEYIPLNKFMAKFAIELLLVPVNYLLMRRFVFLTRQHRMA